MHILDHATFSNISEQMRSVYRDSMAPRLEDLESVVDFYVRAEFGPGKAASFSLDEVLRGDFETRATAVQQLVTSGVMMPSEARPMFDLADAGPVADRLYANAALVELGSNKPTPPTIDAGKPAPELPAAAPKPAGGNRAYRALMGRLGRVKAAGAGPARQALVDEHRRQLGAYIAAQAVLAHTAVSSGSADFGGLADDDTNAELAEVLLALSLATSKTLGDQVADTLGGSYDDGVIRDWVSANATESAGRINAATVDELVALVDDADDPAAAVARYFDEGMGGRLDQISQSRVGVVGGLAEQVAARQAGAITKTWTVTSARPRPSHAAMHGQTVPLGKPFSNGMDGPGDPAGGADEVAGCTCTLSFRG